MCGIVAILRLGERPLPPPSLITTMAAAIAHRGPDDFGVHEDGDVQLAAVRLAVVDVQGGRQPAYGCTRSIVCVYNGETYDHRALREDLTGRGHRIDDACDTSTVPHLYEQHGDALVEHMHGMFAFALWDAANKKLLLGRDRLGIKPLYFAKTADYLLVASELKAILASDLGRRAIDRDALDDVFSLGYPCPPRTMFEGIAELLPAHVAVAHAGQGIGVPRRYWRAPIPPRGAHRAGDARTLAGELREVLRTAVKSHLVADVPVSTALSGGLDSSAIAALAKEVSGAPPEAFSIVFSDRAFDESSHARAMAAFLGATPHEIVANASAAELLPEMLWHTEQPLLVPGAIGGLLLSARQRQEGVRVALTGDGADELLGGYDVFRVARLRRKLDSSWLRHARPMIFRALASITRQPSGLADVVETNAREAEEIARLHGGVYPPWYDTWRLLDVERKALLSPDGRRVRPIAEPPAGYRALVRADVASLDPFDAQLAIELETRLPAFILVISDRSAMAHGIEARVPFLDDRVVEHVLSLPPSVKMRGLREKAVLRDAVEDLLPRSIRRRHKQPFMTPIAPWFFHPGAPESVRAAMTTEAVRDAGLFSPEVVARLTAALATAPARSVSRLRLELVLMQVLGTQLLHRLFVSREITIAPRFSLAVHA